MGKEYSSNDPQEGPRFDQVNGTGKVPGDQPESLLNEVLENTIPSETEPLDPKELAALQEIARQYAGQPLWLDPIGKALVESLLKIRMPAGVQSLTSEMAEGIAEAMFEAPEVKARLDNLWKQLCESVR